MIKKNKRLFSIIQLFLSILSMGILIILIIKSIPMINFNAFSINIKLLVLSIFLVSLTIIFWAVIWSQIVNTITNKETDNLKIINIYILSNLTKYLPGSFWNYVARDLYGKNEGIQSRKIWLVNYLEIFGSIFAGLLVYFISLLSGKYINYFIKPFFLFLIILFLLLFISPPWVNLLFSKIPFVKGTHDFSSNTYNWKLFFKFLISSLVNWGVVCFGVFIFMSSITNLNFSNLLEIFGIWSISIVLGLIAFGIPQGIGIRETILTLLLTPIIGFASASLIAIISRVWLLCCDVLSFIFWFIFKTLNRKIIHKNY